MTPATAPKLDIIHPPLARDSAGNFLPMPAGTAAWRICRETTGRPREIRGPDKAPVRFPLHTTSDDLVELCGTGAYRVYALDQLGELLGDEHVAKWDLTAPRELRNADSALVLRGDRANAVASGPVSDLRFALDAMAQMMKTNTEALRLVAESQVDLAKTIATVKGLPRNAAMFVPPVAANDAEDDEDDEEVVEETASPTSYLDLLMPFSQEIAKKVADFVPGLLATPAKPTAAGAGDDLAARPFEAKELFDLQYAHRKGEAKREAARADSSSLRARVAKDPQLVQQIMAIRSALAPDEIEALMGSAANWSEAAQTKFLDTIKPLQVDEAVVYCREVVATIRERSTAES